MTNLCREPKGASIAGKAVLIARAVFGLTAMALGCNGVLGIDEPRDTDETANTTRGGSGADATGSGASTAGGTSTATGAGGSGNPSGGNGGAGGSGNGSGGSSSGTGGGSNGAGPDGGGRTIEFAWADWPMPNPGTSGLPYPQTYDTNATAGVVVDKVTNLKWQQAVDANAYSWADAQALCAGLTLAGGGWRLPARIELLSIVDFTSANPLIDLRAFPGTPPARFWTASPVAGEPSSAWAVDFAFGNGLTYSAPVTSAYRVRCVR